MASEIKEERAKSSYLYFRNLRNCFGGSGDEHNKSNDNSGTCNGFILYTLFTDAKVSLLQFNSPATVRQS